MENEIKLSLYLEKKVLEILVNEINKHNKTIPLVSEKDQEKLKKDKNIRELIQSLSLVSWYWFNTVSELLFSIVDFYNAPKLEPEFNLFNYVSNKKISSTKNKFQIIKNENVNYLRLNLANYEFEQNLCGPSNENQLISFENSVNENLKKFVNLKKLIISNGTRDEEIYFINKLNHDNIKIGFLPINILNEGDSKEQESSYTKTQSPLSKSIKQAVDCEGSYVQIDRLISILKPLKKIESFFSDRMNINDYKKLYIGLCLDGDEKKLDEPDQGNSSKTESCFSYCQVLSVENYQVQTIESLYYLLKLAPNVVFLTFQICFDNLVKQFDTSGTCKGCICSREHECNKLFYHYWSEISKIIENHKTLLEFNVGHHCTFPIGYQTPFKFPDEFVQEFGKPFISNKSIKIFKTSKLPPNTINFIQHLSNNNKNIVRHEHNYFSLMINNTPDMWVKDFQELVKQNEQIQVFYIDDLTYGEVLTYIKDKINKSYQKE